MTAKINPLAWGTNHPTDMAQAVMVLQAERETLQAKATRLSQEQGEVLARAFELVRALGKEQEEILLKMAEVEQSIVSLVYVSQPE